MSDAAFREHIFYIPEAQRKPEIQPDGMLDYGTRKTMAGIGDGAHQFMIARHSFIAELP